MSTFDRKALEANAIKCGIPDYMTGAVVRYVADRIHPGGFLTAVLTNDLREACSRADDINRHHLFDYIMFLYNYAPAGCWGSPQAVGEWLSKDSEVGG